MDKLTKPMTVYLNSVVERLKKTFSPCTLNNVPSDEISAFNSIVADLEGLILSGRIPIGFGFPEDEKVVSICINCHGDIVRYHGYPLTNDWVHADPLHHGEPELCGRVYWEEVYRWLHVDSSHQVTVDDLEAVCIGYACPWTKGGEENRPGLADGLGSAS